MPKNSFIFVNLVFICLIQNAFQQNSEQLSRTNSNISKHAKHKTDSSSNLINTLNIYFCTALVIVGTFGNCLSFIVFIRAGKKAPRIITKNILILLTISNSVYLILFWYISVFPKLINHFKLDLSSNRNLNFTKTFNLSLEGTYVILAPKNTIGRLFIEKLYLINSNLYVCKAMSYLISVSIFMNSSITVTFSLERALAINFPLKVRNIREKHRFLYKLAMAVIISYCFLFPIYHLYLSDMIKHGNNQFQKKCDIPLKYESLYFKFTMMFVIQTLAIPFILITISNISILAAIERNKRSLLQKRFPENSPEIIKIEKRSRHLNSINSEFSIESFNLPTNKSIHDSINKKRMIFRSRKNLKYTNSLNSSFVTDRVSCKTGGGRDKNMHITKMLITISASFVLLNFPYLISWSKIFIK
jgi:hypothetical protein